jgi:hypothetical protein
VWCTAGGQGNEHSCNWMASTQMKRSEESVRPEPHQKKKFFRKLSWPLPWKHKKGHVCRARRRRWQLLMHQPRSCIWISTRRQGYRRSRLHSPSLLSPPLPYTLYISEPPTIFSQEKHHSDKNQHKCFHIHRSIIKYCHVLCDLRSCNPNLLIRFELHW